MAMVPHERSLVKRLEGKPFALLGIDADPDRETLKKTQTEKNITWRSWFDGRNGPIAREWKVRGFPTVYVLDAKGRIRYKFIGPVEEELDKVVDALMKEVTDKK